jgi:hypothetical protein
LSVVGGSEAGAAATSAKPTSLAVVRTWMHRTTEVGIPGTHFVPISRRVVVSDGHGGSLTAVIGGRTPSADGYGQLVFFFHNQSFLGWDENHEAISIASIRPRGTARFEVIYSHYRSTDPFCCPSLSPLHVGFRYIGRHLQALSRPPGKAQGGAKVILR